MSHYIITKVQEYFQFPLLKKIDPNTGQVVDQANSADNHSFGQAAIPAILAAFSQYVQADEGASDFLHDTHSGNWIKVIFGGKQDKVVQAIRKFSPYENEDYYLELEAIADEILKATKEQLPAIATIKDIKDYFRNEKASILSYLLPELKMGVILDNDSLDDKTHKMDGPVSGLVQSIGAAFDNDVVKE